MDHLITALPLTAQDQAFRHLTDDTGLLPGLHGLAVEDDGRHLDRVLKDGVRVHPHTCHVAPHPFVLAALHRPSALVAEMAGDGRQWRQGAFGAVSLPTAFIAEPFPFRD